MPLSGARPATASVKARRRWAPAGCPAAPQLFLHFHDSLGALQAKREAGILLLEKGHFSRERVGFGDLWAALDRGQGAESACIALPAPVGQRRGVKALTAQNGGDAAGVSRAIRVGENAQLLLGGEDPAVRTSGELR
jgi:hypothetical protein